MKDARVHVFVHVASSQLLRMSISSFHRKFYLLFIYTSLKYLLFQQCVWHFANGLIIKGCMYFLMQVFVHILYCDMSCWRMYRYIIFN